jgi:predicted MFS family arabinose efflux permease
MAMEAAHASGAAASPLTRALGGHRRWALFLLVLVYLFNFIDRTIIGTLGQAIKDDLKISDFQLGILGGFVFALFYSALGLPIARLAERRNRVTIIAAAAAFWSLMTTLCGFAQGYLHLLLARLGVGVGEAGYVPAAQSVITDYYPPEKRSSALAIFNLGIPLGNMFGAFAAGAVAQTWGWRLAFVIVGLPGVVLGLIIKLTVKEPPRGQFDTAIAERPAPLGEVLRFLLAKPAFRHMMMGCGLAAFGGYSLMQFLHPFFVRNFELPYAQAALLQGLIGGIATGISMLIGGFLPDLIGRTDKRWYLWTPAIGGLFAAPAYCLGFMAPGWGASFAVLLAAGIFQYFYLSPTYAVAHNMVDPRMRASAIAILILAMNIIGLMCGPSFTGFMSDVFAGRAFGLGDYAALCPGGKAAAGAAAELAGACKAASAVGLKHALMLSSLAFTGSAVHYWLGARTLRREL